eukprot:TRINITY_DN66115_c0_g1_i1.p1 TRINITY_DN66115_c0_g1~~TRINITY_DN66115_c0_g1_i1.p1  ORF type:complete len:504 (+),score=96.99 TRINITY_DN66115_c0_g1_i1:123-1634(+)
MSGSRHSIVDVWSWNFDAEFGELLAAVSASGEEPILALDTEFPGFLREEKQFAKRHARYEALRQNCDNLRPIQLGISVAKADGSLVGTWCFNLFFDVQMDLHTEESVAFLTAAGLDFPRHAREGIPAARLGRRLAQSSLVGKRGCKPCWVTFQGWYDFGYILRLITNRRLPLDVEGFENLRTTFFPERYELRDDFSRGSLDSLCSDFGVERHGTPHTAGSDALATLELYQEAKREGGPRRLKHAPSWSEASTTASSFHLDTGAGYFHDEGVGLDSNFSGYPGQLGTSSSTCLLGLQALDDLAGTGCGASGSRFANHAAHATAASGARHNALDWDEAIALSVQEGLLAGGWEEAQGHFVEDNMQGHWDSYATSTEDIMPMHSWKHSMDHTMQAQDLAQAVLAAAGAGMAAELLQDPVQQQSQQRAAMQSMLMPGAAVTSTQPMSGYGQFSVASVPRWQSVQSQSDEMWMESSSQMFYSANDSYQQHRWADSRHSWPALVHTMAG